MLLTPSDTLDRLTQGIYSNEKPDDPSGRILHAFKHVLDTSDLDKRLRKHRKTGGLVCSDGNFLTEALEKNIINQDEYNRLEETRIAVLNAIKVDEFSNKGWEVLTPGYGE